MKYITPELLIKQHSDDIHEKEDACKEVAEKFSLYEEYYQRNKNRFSKHFLNIYENNYRFHDWNIEAVSYYPSENQKNDVAELKISHIDTVCILKFYHVTRFCINADNSGNEPLNMPEKDIYYIDEWEFLPNKKIRFEMFSLSFASFEIVCDKVTVKCYEDKLRDIL